MEISNIRAGSGERAENALKSQLLEEKEKRLSLQESLFKTREEQFQYREQIELLKAELRKRPYMTANDRRIITQNEV
jgi:chromosome segregation ATPase